MITEEEFLIWTLRGQNIKELSTSKLWTIYVCRDHPYCILVPFGGDNDVHLNKDTSYKGISPHSKTRIEVFFDPK